MRDLHEVVIDHHGQMIGGHAIGFQEDFIIDRAHIERYLATDHIGKSDGVGTRHLDPYYMGGIF